MSVYLAKERDWRLACVSVDATLQDAIENLDRNAWQICLVTDKSGRLEGTITDGDVRRGLLRGRALTASVQHVIERNSLVVTDEIGPDAVLQLMRANMISQIPAVDKGRRVRGLFLLSDFIQTTATPQLMVIMAGGKGTRLYPHTKSCPKPLVEVHGKPMLEHIIIRARDHGVREFVIAVHHLGHMIESYFKSGSELGVSIRYIVEEFPLGTAGALRLLDPIPKEPFLVTNGDVITGINYGDLVDFHKRNKSSLTMAVRRYEWQQPFGVVQTDGIRITGIEEKPKTSNYINAGIYVVEPSTLSCLKDVERIDMPELFDRVTTAGGLATAYPMHESWIDVGQPYDLERVRQEAI